MPQDHPQPENTSPQDTSHTHYVSEDIKHTNQDKTSSSSEQTFITPSDASTSQVQNPDATPASSGEPASHDSDQGTQNANTSTNTETEDVLEEPEEPTISLVNKNTINQAGGEERVGHDKTESDEKEATKPVIQVNDQKPEQEQLEQTQTEVVETKDAQPLKQEHKAENEDTTDEEDDEGSSPTERLPAVIVPKKQPPALPSTTPPLPPETPAASIPQRPSTEKNEISEQQEKAVQYIERKRTSRLSRITAQIEAVVLGKNGRKSPDGLDDPMDGPTMLLPTPRNQDAMMLMPGGGSPIVRSARSLREQRRKKMLVRYLSRKHMRQNWNEDERTSRRFWFTFVSTILVVFILGTSIIAGGAAFAVRFMNDTKAEFIDEVKGLRSLVPHDNLKMYDVHGTLIGQMQEDGLHTSVTYDKFSKDLVNATVATEDKDFWNNPGFDLLRIIQAAIQNLQHGEVVGGGSTITQQLIKNLVIRNSDQTALRKFQELVLAPEIVNNYSKQDIMEMYLNSIDYGHQSHGANAAASVYFGLEDLPDKPAVSQLTLAQSAMLAGLPQAPSAYDPWNNREKALNRMEIVLELMARNGYITRTAMENAIEEAKSPDFFKRPESIDNKAPHFFDYALSELADQQNIWQEMGIEGKPTREQMARSGIKLYTTLDLGLNDKLLPIAKGHVDSLRDRNVNNSAQVLIDYRNGAIRALHGSVDYYNKDIDGSFNVATQGYRQMGSSFKPYVYATAFSQGYSPGQGVSDFRISYPQPGSEPYSPNNYDMQFHGHMTLRCALQNSLNIPAVKTISKVGVDPVIENIKKLGITDFQGVPGLATSLGSLEMLLVDHVSAFGTFANGGLHKPHYAIEKVEVPHLNKSYDLGDNPGEQVFTPQVAFMMTDVLTDNDSRAPQFGACNSLVLRRGGNCWEGDLIPAAVKTGTTNDFKDVLTVGYTSEFILGVWVGNSNGTPMTGITGIDGSAPIWHDAMISLMEGREARGFENPGGLNRTPQTYGNGVSTTDWMLPGKQPPVAPVVPTQENKDKDKDKPKPAVPYCGHYRFASNPSANHPSGAANWW